MNEFIQVVGIFSVGLFIVLAMVSMFRFLREASRGYIELSWIFQTIVFTSIGMLSLFTLLNYSKNISQVFQVASIHAKLPAPTTQEVYSVKYSPGDSDSSVNFAYTSKGMVPVIGGSSWSAKFSFMVKKGDDFETEEVDADDVTVKLTKAEKETLTTTYKRGFLGFTDKKYTLYLTQNSISQLQK